jgi:cell division inhibitor SepF
MSTLHKFKAYFGMVPLDECESDCRAGAAPAPAPDRRPRDEAPIHPVSPREPAPRRPRELPEEPGDGPSAHAARLGSHSATTGQALAADTAIERPDEQRRTPVADGNPLSGITTVRPRDYSEARTIGERFRDGTPVLMDLVETSNADAKQLVDFATGLAFALRGSFDKVATKVFLLSPADLDVSAEERRRLAETGFRER